MQPKRGGSGDCHHPDTIRTLRRKLYAKAKQEPAYRFYALYDKISRDDVLNHAWRLVRANRGSPGVDGIRFEAIENRIVVKTFLRHLARDLKDKTYRAQPVRRVMILRGPTAPRTRWYPLRLPPHLQGRESRTPLRALPSASMRAPGEHLFRHRPHPRFQPRRRGGKKGV